MYAIIYTHKYGTDVSIADTEEEAFQFAEEIVAYWRDDFKVDPDLSDGDALQDWVELTGGTESIDVQFVWHVKDCKREEEEED
jgi:hypothetical protein